MLYRVKQFFWAITAKLEEDEKQFIKKHLFLEEQELFNQLKIYEQKHSMTVARALQQCYKGEDQEEMVRIGLLHDIGKIRYPIGPIRKSVMVLADKFTKGKVSQLGELKMVKCYYEHPKFGYEILSREGQYNQMFLELIRGHHQENHEEDERMAYLQKCDDEA